MNFYKGKRREFFRTAVSLGVVAMSPNELFANEDTASLTNLNNRRPDPEQQSTLALKAIAFGLHAPNPHNTQAWKFKIISAQEFLFYIDPQKCLPMTDPTTRQIHMGCGAFLAAMQAGVSQFGALATIELFPEGTTEGAQFQRPVARVTLQNEKLKPHRFATIVRTRMTSRLKYTDALTQNDFNAVLATLPELKSSVHLFNDSLEDLRSVLKEAFLIEMKTERTSDESRLLFRSSQADIEKFRDGLNLPTAGTLGFKRWFLETFIDFTSKKEWHSERSLGIATGKINEGLDTTFSFMTLRTKYNSVEDWIVAGSDYFTLQAAFFEKGFYFHPMSQALQEYSEVQELQKKLEVLVNSKGTEKTQMIVRVGRSEKPWMSYRNSPQAFLV